MSQVDAHAARSMSPQTASIRLQNPPVTGDNNSLRVVCARTYMVLGQHMEHVTGMPTCMISAESGDNEPVASLSTPTGRGL